MPIKSNEDDRADYSAPALEKGLDILELLAEEGSPMTARQIGERMGRSKNEIFRMVYVLVDRGYLHRDLATDQLSLTNHLFELGMKTPRSRMLVDVALPAMERLSNAVGHSSHLVVVSRGQTVVIVSATARTEFNFSLQLGYGNPATDAVSGQTIIAFQFDERRRAMINESFALLTKKPSMKQLNEQLIRIANTGSVIADSHYLVGVTDICAPILDKSGNALASIVLPCLKRIGAEGSFENIRDRLVMVCREISDALR
jgi:DNA-binding IclR family transcriptional regulator